MSLRIGIDLDGVVHDFVGAYRRFLRSFVGHRHTMPEPTRWDFYEDWNVTKADFLAHLNTEGAVFDGKPYPGAIGALDQLRDAGHSIHIVTHRPASQVRTTCDWLEKWSVPYDTLTFAEDKTIAKVDVFLEDNVENYEALRAAGVQAFLLDRPWNRDRLARRVDDWGHFRSAVAGQTLIPLSNGKNDIFGDFVPFYYDHDSTARPTTETHRVDTITEPASDTTNPKDAIGLTKAPLRLLPGPALIYMAKVMELGAGKYGAWNWRSKKVRFTVYLEAAMRHLLRALDGEDADPESGMPPAAHVAACMAIVLDAHATGNLVDDRPTPGATAKLIEGMAG